MRGTVKFFDNNKGWGFITDSEGKDFFFHHSNIQMEGHRALNEDDIVDFEIGQGTNNGREQAVNVKPILTTKMVENALKEENLHLQTVKDAYGVKKYLVVNADNVLQTSEQGMSLVEISAFAGFDTKGLEENGGKENMMNKEQTINKIIEEYSEYGIENGLAEQVYDMAIQNGVADELIYPGMKMIFNNALGIDNTDVIKEVGEGFTQFAVNDTRKSNPTVTDKVIAKNMEEELADRFDWKSLEMPNGIVNAIKDATEQFIKNNK